MHILHYSPSLMCINFYTSLNSFLGPNGIDARQPMYPGFERDVFRTVAEHFQRLKEPLLTFHLYEIFVSILGE